MNISRSGVHTALLGCYMADVTWNCCHLGAHSAYTIQPCTRIPCQLIQSTIRWCMCVELSHVWQDDWDLLRFYCGNTGVRTNIGISVRTVSWPWKLSAAPAWNITHDQPITILPKDPLNTSDLCPGTLPPSVRQSSSLSSFKSKLKTHLFSSAYWFVVFFLLILPINPSPVMIAFL